MGPFGTLKKWRALIHVFTLVSDILYIRVGLVERERERDQEFREKVDDASTEGSIGIFLEVGMQ